MPAVVKRGGLLLVSKFVIGAALGIAVGKIFGSAGFLGISSMAIICAVTNSNGFVYYALMEQYGDEKDCACMPILALNDGPFLTLVALGASGLADIPFMSLVAAVVPIFAGMLLGNIDPKVKDFFGPVGSAIIPFTGFSLGAGINLANVVKGGVSGVVLGLITIFIGGAFIVCCDRFIGKRPGYAGWAVATTAGNAVAVPAAHCHRRSGMGSICICSNRTGGSIYRFKRTALYRLSQPVGKEVWQSEVQTITGKIKRNLLWANY